MSWLKRLQPALFLHFALSFPEERFKNLRRRWLLPLVYAPGAGLLGLWVWSLTTREATKLLLDRLNQIATAYDAIFYVAAALLFMRSYSRATTPLLRQQLKWVTRGTLLAVLPFTLFYAVPYLLHWNPPQLLTNLAGLSLVFLPLTFAWAIVRYRLMDTDLIFKRGVAYTLATALILGGYFGIIALIAVVVHHRPAGRRARVGLGHRHSWPSPPSSILSSAAFRDGSTAPSTAIATTIAGRWSSSAAASAPKPTSRPCSIPSSSSCRALFSLPA